MWTRVTSECFVEPAWRAATQRPNHAEMSRTAFLGLVTGWCGTLCGLLAVAIVVRAVS